MARASRFPGVAGAAYVLSSPLFVEAGGGRSGGLGLGVIGDEYFGFFRAPRFVRGAPPVPGQSGWAVLTEDWAGEIGSALGHPLSPGFLERFRVLHRRIYFFRKYSSIFRILFQKSFMSEV